MTYCQTCETGADYCIADDDSHDWVELCERCDCDEHECDGARGASCESFCYSCHDTIDNCDCGQSAYVGDGYTSDRDMLEGARILREERGRAL